MSREERGALLHEGSGSAVMSAYVEVIFDNSDRRFPNEKDTLVLRRTIGYKKDEFSLDKKNAEKQEVMNMLETAGFSRSNPYYIVPQGRVTAITNMKDAQRLAMLKEVAGTQIYEDRRTESLKIMQDTSNKREKIDETLTYIAERLDELEEEKNELREYQTKDKDRRCLEYAFFDREQTIINEKLAEIEDLRQTGTDTLEDKLETLQRGEEIVLDHASEIKKLTQKIEALKRSRAQLEEDRRSMASMKAKVELDVKNLIDGKASREKAQVNHQAQLKQVKAAIAAANAELATIIPEFTKRQVNESEMQAKLEASKAALERLQNKQGRNQNFKSKGERDKALQKQIEQSLVNQGEQKEVLMDATEQVSALQKNAQALEAELQMIEKRLEAWPAQLKTLADKEALAHTKHESLLDQRRHLWREEKDLEEQERSLKDDYHRAKKELSNMMDGNTARGLEAVRRLKLQEDIPGAYGTIADLMEVPDEYRIAVEQVGGNSLFHYVVENADVATQLVNHLQQVQGGRLTFMPLAQIRKRNVKLPNAVDAVPLLQKVKFDPKFEAAFSQIFGKTIICESLAIAGSYSRSHGCDAVTLEGDKTSDKGALTGGYIDRKRSRLRAVQIMNKLAGEHEAAAARLSAIRKQIEQNDQETTSAQGELQKARYAVQQFDDARERLPRELRGKRQEHQTILALLRDVTKQRENADQAMRKVMDDVAALQVELASDFKKTLSSSEERQLVELETTIRQLQQDRDKLSEKRRELGKRKATIEIDIQQNLQPKLDSLNTQDMDTSTASSSGDLKASQGELRRITQVASEVEDKLQENEAQFDEAQTIIQVIQQEKAEKEQQLEELAQNIEKHQRRMNKSVAKRTALQERATECQKVIRDLGVLPEEAFTKYQNAESKTVSIGMYRI